MRSAVIATALLLVRVPGKRGIEEVLVDAGSGKALGRTHETPAQEAPEKTGEKGTAPAR